MTDKTGTGDQVGPEKPRRPHWWSNRSTGDILILMVTTTVCFGVIFSGLVVAYVSVVTPEKDVTVWVNRNSGIINTMLGVVAGYLAGRTDRSMRYQYREQDRDEPVE